MISPENAGVSLTTIDHSIEEKGNAAVRLLMESHDTVSDKDKQRSALMRLEYEPVLLVRNSTGQARRIIS